MNSYIKKITTLPSCWEYISLMEELSKMNKNNNSLTTHMNFTLKEYNNAISNINNNHMRSKGKNHTLICNNTDCNLYYLAKSPSNSNLNYCVNKYADKFR